MLIRYLIFLLLSISCVGQENWGTTQTGLLTGVTNIILPAGTGPSPSFTFISSAYNQETVYSGWVDAINGSTLTLDGFTGTELEDPPWADNELAQTPHLLRVVDGNADGNANVFSTVNGHVFNVIGHVGNDLTVNLPPGQMSSYFAIYDGVQIIKATTLESLFGVGEDFIGTSGTPGASDNILIWSSVGWKVYFHYNDKWQTFGTRADQSSTIIFPDEGMVYVRRGDAHTLSFSGLVPPSVQSYLPGPGGKFLMSNPYPVVQTISQLIDTNSNWIQSNDPNNADQILSWSGTAWISYYNNIADDWVNTSTGQVDDYEFQPGESFFIIRSNNMGNGVVQGYNKIDFPEE
jgi:hypothetical protein